MRIQHNIMAMSAYRNYTNNVSAMQKNLEKLSSGYKINRAGDDAAGLAISEKMRAQITGLETAQKNAKDGISLVQTAEGALTEVHDMLNRMVELASMSANGTYDNTTDRAQLQKELNQLRSEINRIADSANFNGINLLDGSMQDGATVGVETNTVDIVKDLLPEQAADNNELGVKADKTVVETAAVSASGAKFEISLKGLQTITASGTKDTFSLTIGNDTLTVTLGNGANKAEDIATLFKNKFNGTTATASIGGKDFTITADGDTLKFESKEKVDLVPGAKVTWEWKPDGKTAEHADDGIMSLDEGGPVVYATGTGEIANVDPGENVTVGSDAKINTGASGVSLKDTLTSALDTAGAASGNISLKYDSGESAWQLSVGSTNLDNVSASYADNKLTVSVGSEVALEITVTPGDTTTTNPTEDDVKAAFNSAQTVGTYTAPAEESGSTPSVTPPSATTPSATTPSAVAGTATLNMPAVDGATGDYGSATSATKVGSGDGDKLTAYFRTGAGSSIKVDGHDVNLSSVTVADNDSFEDIAKKIGAAVKAELDKDTANTYSDIKVQIGTDTPIAIQANGSMPQITVTYNKTAKQTTGGDTDVGDSKFHGVINSGLQNTDSGADAAAEILANTRIDLSKDKVDAWKDGTQITIGSYKTTLVFDKDSKNIGKNGYLDMTDCLKPDGTVDVNAAAEKLANAANEGNEHFVVGHDKQYITLQQKDAKYDMETVEGIASYLGVTTVGAQEGKEIKTGQSLRLQIGDTADKWNQLEVDIRDTHCKSLGKIDENGNVVGMSLADISIADQNDAAKAIDVIKDAINTVSDIRGTLGATQNRLDHTINNLSVMTENIQDAESTIRDVDVAEEMMAYTKNNILIQSAQAMLAQANQVPQGVLQLLQ